MLRLLCLLLAMGSCVFAAMRNDSEVRHNKCQDVQSNIYGYEFETLTGEKQNLTKYRGKVLLIINVATFCGYTEQYKDFNQIMERNPGVQILAFPCNQFHMQEPGRNDEILHGLKHVRPGGGWEPSANVHIYGKIEVNGEHEHPMYTFLKSTCPQTSDKIGNRDVLFWDPIKGSDVVWNFEKYLIDKKGRPRVRFFPGTWNNGKRVEEHFQELLNEED
uniref:Glutathione peroxidase n=2 Tax=Plectus sambesii TaxID=2011161 RepID=A0A914WBD8_9BILA